jgi:hypothetical protein
LFEEGIARGEGHAVVAAFDDEVDGGEHGFHFREARGVVSQEVGAGEGELGGKCGTGDEGCHFVGWREEYYRWAIVCCSGGGVLLIGELTRLRLEILRSSSIELRPIRGESQRH